MSRSASKKIYTRYRGQLKEETVPGVLGPFKKILQAYIKEETSVMNQLAENDKLQDYRYVER